MVTNVLTSIYVQGDTESFGIRPIMASVNEIDNKTNYRHSVPWEWVITIEGWSTVIVWTRHSTYNNAIDLHRGTWKLSTNEFCPGIISSWTRHHDEELTNFQQHTYHIHITRFPTATRYIRLSWTKCRLDKKRSCRRSADLSTVYRSCVSCPR